MKYICESGLIQYFSFTPPRGRGTGGKRLYGQDLTFAKELTICVGETSVKLSNLDSQIGFPRQVFEISGHTLFVSIQKEGKTVLCSVSSGVNLYSCSFMPLSISVAGNNKISPVGTCYSRKSRTLMEKNPLSSRYSKNFGVPSSLLKSFRSDWQSTGSSKLSLLVTPKVEHMPAEWKFEGVIHISLNQAMFQQQQKSLVKSFELTCRPTFDGSGDSSPETHLHPLVIQVVVVVELAAEYFPVVNIMIHPRAIIENKLPVPVSIRTPMPNALSKYQPQVDTGKESLHTLDTNESMEIFTPGPSIAITAKCADKAVAGASSDWMSGWVDLPLVPQFRLPEPLKCEFPFVRRTDDPLSLSGARGSEFFIVEGSTEQTESSLESSTLAQSPTHNRASEGGGIEVAAPSSATGADEEWRRFVVTVCNYAVDHTGDILFEQVESSTRGSYRRSMTDTESGRRSTVSSNQVSVPFGAYGSSRYRGRVTLLPASNVMIRLLHLTMEGEEGMRKSSPFRIDDVSISEGGVDSTPLKWEDGTPSGYFAYRSLLNSYQSEIHIVPEFVVFNGSKMHHMRVKQPGGYETVVEPGKIAPLRTHSSETATIAVELFDLGARTALIRVDSLGLRVAVARSQDGAPMGSIAVQTVVGAGDSRLVVKLGEMKCAALETAPKDHTNSSTFANDFFRFRVQWSELRITLDEGRPIAEKNQAFFESAMDRIREAALPPSSPRPGVMGGISAPSPETWVEARARVSSGGVNQDSSAEERTGDAVCTILFHRYVSSPIAFINVYLC